MIHEIIALLGAAGGANVLSQEADKALQRQGQMNQDVLDGHRDQAHTRAQSQQYNSTQSDGGMGMGMGMGGMAPVQLDSMVKPKGRRSTGSFDLLVKLLKASNTVEGEYM